MIHPQRQAPTGAIAAPVAAALIALATYATASGQTGVRGADRFTAMVEAICRGFAAAQTGMPPDPMFEQCMAERHCRVIAGSATYRCEAPGPLQWHGGGY